MLRLSTSAGEARSSKEKMTTRIILILEAKFSIITPKDKHTISTNML